LQALLANQEPIPIPNVQPPVRDAVSVLVRIIIFLTRNAMGNPTSHPRDPLMREYYEELLNALVYELYLPEELHTAGLRMFERVAAARLPALDAPAARSAPGDARLLTALREKFEELYAPTHPLRAALQKLHTLDPIRIIEGKA
jgi:hypothetical protein